MVPLYAMFVVLLGGLKAALARRATRVGRKYTASARAAEQAARAVRTKPGNASAADPLTAAKQQYELGRLVQVRDGLELKYLAALTRSNRADAALAKARGWKGRAVPYLLGVADVTLALVALHHLGLPQGLTPVTGGAWAPTLGL